MILPILAGLTALYLFARKGEGIPSVPTAQIGPIAITFDDFRSRQVPLQNGGTSQVLMLRPEAWARSIGYQLSLREARLMGPRQKNGLQQAWLTKPTGKFPSALSWMSDELKRGNAILVTMADPAFELLSLPDSLASEWAEVFDTAQGPRAPRGVIAHPLGLGPGAS